MTDFIDGLHDKIGKKHDELDGSLDQGEKAFKGIKGPVSIPEVNPDFVDGEELDGPPGGTAPAPAAPGGSLTLGAAGKIEFIHFGTVYRDRASYFVHPEIDDLDPDAFLEVPAGRGIMFRAGLERELILLACSIQACANCFEQDYGPKAAEGDAMSGLAGALGGLNDMFGGSRGLSTVPTPADLNAFGEKAFAIGTRLDKATVEYPELHAIGIEIHELRVAYQQHLETQLEQFANGAGGGGGGILGGLPFIGSLIPGAIGEYIDWAYKIPMIAFEVYVGMVLKLNLLLDPAIAKGCRELTIDAIRERRAPVYPLWFLPEQLVDNPFITPPESPDSVGVDAIDNAVGGAVGAAQDAVGEVNKVVDFISRPAKVTPGSKYLDMAFLLPEPDAPTDPNAPKRTDTRFATDLGEVFVTAFGQALDADPLPPWIQWPILRVAEVNAEFLRAIYGVLLSLDSDTEIDADELVEAARIHLVDKLIEIGFECFDFIEQFRNLGFELNNKRFGIDGLIARAKEELHKQLGFLDEVVGYFLHLVGDRLSAARGNGLSALTMEVYLAELPSLHALLFRNTFHPLWDLLVDSVFGPVADQLMEVLGPAGGFLGDVSDRLTEARTIADNVKRVKDAAMSRHELDAKNPGKVLEPFEEAWQDAPAESASPEALQRTDQTFPFTARKTACQAAPVTATQLGEVEDLKWQGTGQADEDGASSEEAGA